MWQHICDVVQDCHLSPPWHTGWSADGGLLSPVLFSLYVNDMLIPFYHVDLALYADDTAIIATSRKTELLVSYLESYISDMGQ